MYYKDLPEFIGQGKVLKDLGMQFMTDQSKQKTRVAMLECGYCKQPFRMAVKDLSHKGHCNSCSQTLRNSKTSERFDIANGTRFNKLTILETDNSKIIGKTSRKMFKVKCDCGEIFSASGTLMRRNKITSCKNCSFINRSKISVKTTQNEMVFTKRVLNRCNTKHISVSITADEYIEKAKMNCHYCNAEPMFANGTARLGESLLKIHGLDRIDASLGYTHENTVSCCVTCNTMKASMSTNEFLLHINKVYKNNFTGQ